MTPTEVNAVLTFAALLDPRMKRTDPNEMADRAEAWASALDAAGVEADVAAARAAVERHYATSRDPLMVADLIDLIEPNPALLGIDGDDAWDAELARRAKEISA
jgi:hypothetical protein